MGLIARLPFKVLLVGLVLLLADATASATVPEGLEVDLTSPVRQVEAGAPVPVELAVEAPGQRGRVRVAVTATAGLAKVDGAGEGPLEDGAYTTTLLFRATADGWQRADVTVTLLADDGAALGHDRNSIFFLREAGRVWVSTSSEIDLRLARLRALGGGTEDVDAAATAGAESLGAILGSILPDSITVDGPLAAPGAEALAAPTDSGEAVSGITVKGRIRWTDASGAVHPVPQAEVQVYDRDGASTDTLITTTTTDSSGNYSVGLSFDDGAGEGGPDVFVRVLTRSDAASIHAPGVSQPYFMQSAVSSNVGAGATVTANLTAGNAATAQNAFSIHHALVVAADYATRLVGTPLPQLETIYPTDAGTSSFLQFGPNQLHIALKGPAVVDLTAFAWDVVQHEYGHYVQGLAGFVDTPGILPHAFDTNLTTYGDGLSKDAADRLAWSEAWPTFFALSAQAVEGAGALGIPDVGDARYQAPYAGIDVDLEARGGQGEDDELSIGAFLWDLFDQQQDGEDRITFSDLELFVTFKDAAVTTMGEAWEALTAGRPVRQRSLIGRALAQSNIAPALLGPADGTALAAGSIPTFRWERNGGGTPNPLNNWEITFYQRDLQTVILTVNDQARFSRSGSTAQFTPTASEWASIVAGGAVVRWVVGGRSTAAPPTPSSAGRYWSQAGILGDGAVLLAISPLNGSPGQSLDVTLTRFGAGFSGSSSVSFGAGVTVDSLSITGPTTAVVGITIAGSAALGPRSVTVQSGGVTTTSAGAFSVVPEVVVTPGGVVITSGPSSSSNPVPSGGTTTFSVGATGPIGSPLSAFWTVECSGLGGSGTFGAGTPAGQPWTAPVNPTGESAFCTVSVTVEATSTGDSATASFQQQVLPPPYSVFISSGPSSDTNPVYAGGQALVSVVGGTNSPEPLTYAWSANCPGAGAGSFGNPGASTTTWTAPSVGSSTQCSLNVQVAAAGAGSASGALLQRVEPVPATTTQLYANILPSSRSGRVGQPATAFAAVVNGGGNTAVNCTIAPATSVPATFSFQRTDPATNAAAGAQGQPVNIPPGAAQTFVIALTPTATFPATDVQFNFDCANTAPAPRVGGLNTLLISGSTGNPADVIAIVASLTNDGISVVPGASGTGFFSVAGINIGGAENLRITPVANAGVPVSLSICETTGNPDGACHGTPGAYWESGFGTNDLRTYTVFVQGNGTIIPVDLANSRATIRFSTISGAVRGATSIAVQTGGAS